MLLSEGALRFGKWRFVLPPSLPFLSDVAKSPASLIDQSRHPPLLTFYGFTNSEASFIGDERRQPGLARGGAKEDFLAGGVIAALEPRAVEVASAGNDAAGAGAVRSFEGKTPVWAAPDGSAVVATVSWHSLQCRFIPTRRAHEGGGGCHGNGDV